MTESRTATKAVAPTGHLRPYAVGALSGAMAGFLFAVCAVLIQTAITETLITRYGSSVDVSMVFYQPSLIIPLCLLGALFGLAYATARLRTSWPAAGFGVAFAVLMALVVGSLLLFNLMVFSTVVSVTRSFVMANGFTKSGTFGEDAIPSAATVSLLAVLLLLEGLAIHIFNKVGMRWMPRLPNVAYGAITAGLGLPGLTMFGLLLFISCSQANCE